MKSPPDLTHMCSEAKNVRTTIGQTGDPGDSKLDVTSIDYGAGAAHPET